MRQFCIVFENIDLLLFNLLLADIFFFFYVYLFLLFNLIKKNLTNPLLNVKNTVINEVIS